MTISNNNPDEQVFTLRDLFMNYLALARRGVRYWFRGAVVFTAFFLVGLALVVTKARVYKSESAFQVQEVNTTGTDSDASEEHIQRSVEARLNQVYGSRRYMMNIVRELHLYDHLLGTGADGRPLTSESKIVDIFTGAIDRRVERNIVHLGFVHKEPLKAQQVVQALIRLFVNERKMAAEEQARDTLQLVEGQLRELEGVLAQRQEALDRFVIANQSMVERIRVQRGGAAMALANAMSAQAGMTAHTPTGTDSHTSGRTRGLRARVSQLQSALEALRNPSAAPAASNDDPPEVQAMRQRVHEKRDAVASLRSRGLTADHPTRAAAERELAELEANLNSLIARHRGVQRERETLSESERAARIEQLTRDLQSARAELSESERSDNAGRLSPTTPEAPQPVAAPPGQLTNIVEVEAMWDRLTNDLNGTRTAYNDLLRRKLERQSDLRRIQLAGGETVRIIDPPSRPVEPEPPGRTKLASIALFLALMMGLGTALVSGFLDTRVYDLTDLRRWGELPELPYIPELHLDAPAGRPSQPAASDG